MKSVRINFVAAIVSALVLLSVSLSVAQTQQPKSPPKTGQEKSDKNKKPGQEEGNQDDQVVKLGTQLVTVPFNVTDKKNRYINDLSKDDIEVLEDSKGQQVFSFERQTDLPITIAMLIPCRVAALAVNSVSSPRTVEVLVGSMCRNANRSRASRNCWKSG